MDKRIELGEEVIGSTYIGRYGNRQIVGRLAQIKKGDDPFLIRARNGLLHPCRKVRRLRERG